MTLRADDSKTRVAEYHNIDPGLKGWVFLAAVLERERIANYREWELRVDQGEYHEARAWSWQTAGLPEYESEEFMIFEACEALCDAIVKVIDEERAKLDMLTDPLNFIRTDP